MKCLYVGHCTNSDFRDWTRLSARKLWLESSGTWDKKLADNLSARLRRLPTHRPVTVGRWKQWHWIEVWGRNIYARKGMLPSFHDTRAAVWFSRSHCSLDSEWYSTGCSPLFMAAFPKSSCSAFDNPIGVLGMLVEEHWAPPLGRGLAGAAQTTVV